MTFKEIQEMVKLISKMNLTEFKIKDGDFEMTVRTEGYMKTKGQPTLLQSAPAQMVPMAPQMAVATPPSSKPSEAPQRDLPAEQGPAGTEQSKGGGEQYKEIKSPMVGTFYRSSTPEKPPYVQVGDTVEKGATVCIIEAMKLFNEIESEISGKIVKVMVDDAQPVEYDQVLFLVDSNG